MAEANWAEKVNIKLNKMNEAREMEMEDWKKRSIYKVPTSIKDLNKKAYIPQDVSFGPYHHGEDHLLPMENHKERALLHFLKRSDKPLQLLINCLKEVVEDLKSPYAMLPTEWQKDNNDFIRLMILDGCFMLEFLHNNEQPLEDYADHDPIFSRSGMFRMMPRMIHDMLMLENQLPMLVLEKLLAFEGEQKDIDERLNKLILKLFFPYEPPALGKCLHVLDVYRKNLIRGLKYQGGGEESVFNVNIPSATELNLAGIRLRKGNTASLEDISFNGGTLKLPPIVVEDDTELRFLNLIAYERYHIGTGSQEITSYIYLMDCIIDTEKDVAFLKSRKIIQNLLGSEKDVAELFNSLGNGIILDSDSKICEVLINVQEQYDKPWIAWRTDLSRIVESFRNRWAFLSLVAAICLFALATTQTVYTVGAYYKNDSPPTPPAVPPPPPPAVPPPPLVISRRHGSNRS